MTHCPPNLGAKAIQQRPACRYSGFCAGLVRGRLHLTVGTQDGASSEPRAPAPGCADDSVPPRVPCHAARPLLFPRVPPVSGVPEFEFAPRLGWLQTIRICCLTSPPSQLYPRHSPPAYCRLPSFPSHRAPLALWVPGGRRRRPRAAVSPHRFCGFWTRRRGRGLRTNRLSTCRV